MTYAFKKAEPVQIVGTGAKKLDNPFTDAVASIAWKNNTKTGKPEALSFTEEYEDDKALNSLKNRIRRFMRDAGSALDTPGTVRTAFEPAGDHAIKITFWVVKLQERPRDKKTEQA